MNFQEAKSIFKEKYKDYLELVDEHPKELFYKIPNTDKQIKICEEDIIQFCTLESEFNNLQNTPYENSIISKNYTEQVVNYGDTFRRRFFLGKTNTYIFGGINENDIYAEISSASDLYIQYFRFHESYLKITLGRNSFIPHREFEDYRKYAYRPLTIKVFHLNTQSITDSIRLAEQIINTCFFEYAYLKNVAIDIIKDWPRKHSIKRRFKFGETHTGTNLPLSKALFNSDIIKFYQRGLSTEDPFTQFISFYQVLEYYFISVADEQLYSALSKQINDPKFHAAPKHLDRLIQSTLEHKRETDETEMLKLVLNKYVNEDEIVDFINSYEEYLSDNLFTKKRKLFSEDNEVKLVSGHIIGNVAKRIKLIRNALVHSSDRYNRNERYVPSNDSELQLEKEIPLLKFLAERVIISTAK